MATAEPRPILDALLFLLRQDLRRSRAERQSETISDAERWHLVDGTVIAEGLIDRLLALGKEST